MRISRLGVKAALWAAVVAAAALLAAVASAGTVTPVVAGLDNPRDLAFGPNGKLYVAEAGHGGPECFSGGEEGTTCVGFTSGISVIDTVAGTATRIVDGLASAAGEDGFAAVGLDGISFLGHGLLYGIMALSSDAVPPSGLSA